MSARSGGPDRGVSDVQPPLRWIVRLDLDPVVAGALNMARDEAAARVTGGGDARAMGEPPTALLRFYRWERPTLSLGRNEPARDRFDPHMLAAAGVDVVRRPTGGRAVLHDRELTYSVVVPLTGRASRARGPRDPTLHPSGDPASATGPLSAPRELYTRINRALAEGLRRLGVPAEVSGDGPVPGVDAGPCFDAPAPGEVVAQGRKLVGSAQARIGGALLQHGSILIANDQPRIAGFARAIAEVPAGGSPPITLGELLDPPPDPSELAGVLADALRDDFAGAWSRWPSRVDEEVASRMARAEVELDLKHRDPKWVWRR